MYYAKITPTVVATCWYKSSKDQNTQYGSPLESHGEKRFEIQGGGQEMAVMVRCLMPNF